MSETQNIVANTNKLVDKKEVSFRFNKDELGNKRANVTVTIDVPSVEGLIHIIETGGKGLELLLECASDVVRSVAKEKVSSDERVKDQESFAQYEGACTWEAIANMAKEDRRSTAISEEQWKAFGVSYLEIMPGLTGKTEVQVGNALKIYMKKFTACRSDKDVLERLKVQLATFADQPIAENYMDILQMLFKRLDNYLSADAVEDLKANI
jgi:hypothetical protein